MNLGRGCDVKGAALHQIGHVLGLGHIHEELPPPETEKQPEGVAELRRAIGDHTPLQGKYSRADLLSVMRISGQAEFGLEQFAGQINGLSQGDVMRFASAYACLTSARPQVPTAPLMAVLRSQADSATAPATHSGCVCRGIGGSPCAGVTNGFCCNADNDPQGPWCYTQGDCFGRVRDYCTPKKVDPMARATRSACTCSAELARSCGTPANGYCCNSGGGDNWCFTEGRCGNATWDYCDPPEALVVVKKKKVLPASARTSDWAAVDGGFDRGCRGRDYSDKQASYFEIYHHVQTLKACQDLCVGAAVTCTALSFVQENKTCEIWSHEVASTVRLDGGLCLAWVPLTTTTTTITTTTRTTTLTSTRTTTSTSTTPPTTTTSTVSTTFTGGALWSYVANGIGSGYACVPDPQAEKPKPNVADIEACQELCVQSGCWGMSFQTAGGYCTLWDVPISGVKEMPGTTCMQYGSQVPHVQWTTTQLPRIHSLPDWAAGDIWEPLDGGLHRECRGSTTKEVDKHVQSLLDIASIDTCMDLCRGSSHCNGFTFSSGSQCDLWVGEQPQTTVYAVSSVCLRLKEDLSEEYAAGWSIGSWGGDDRACRGHDPDDNSENYYILYTNTPNFAVCKARCATLPEPLACYGIQHEEDSGRCEVWTRPIGSSARAPGSKCWTYAARADRYLLRGGGPVLTIPGSRALKN